MSRHGADDPRSRFLGGDFRGERTHRGEHRKDEREYEDAR
jgi:hypothetical protein